VDRGVTRHIENFILLPGLLSLLFFHFLSLFFFNDILLFTHLLGCPSAVVTNMLPATALCGSWCEGADKPGCRVHRDCILALQRACNDGLRLAEEVESNTLHHSVAIES